MIKITNIFFAICIASISANGQKEFKIDTMIANTYDTTSIRNSKYTFGYERDTAIISFFKPYFVKDICEPGCYQHPTYKSFFNKGKDLINVAMKSLIESFNLSESGKTGEEIRRILKNVDFANCTLIQTPVYYLSPNIVLYTTGQGLKQFFTLDTTYITYRLMKGDKLIAMIRYFDNKSRLWPDNFFSLSYQSVVSLQPSPPICLSTNMMIPGKFGYTNAFNFGYLEGEHLISSNCIAGNYFLSRNGEKIGEVYKQSCTTSMIEKIYEKAATDLKDKIDAAYKRLSQ